MLYGAPQQWYIFCMLIFLSYEIIIESIVRLRGDENMDYSG